MNLIHELLRDDYSFEKAEMLQIKYHKLVDRLTKKDNIKEINSIKTIVGVDVSYFNMDKSEYGVACAVVWDVKQAKELSQYFAKDVINFPYKPGFLGFRESRILSEAISKIPNNPDLLMCDGHGEIHPRRFGEAVHLGFALDIPSIGVAKNPFFGYYDWKNKQYIKGNKAPIWVKNPEINFEANELLGYAICLKEGSKPVFISPGYNVSLETALKICLESTMEHRIPEPIYLADKLSREEMTKYI
jgi:deoxyribonuclease V